MEFPNASFANEKAASRARDAVVGRQCSEPSSRAQDKIFASLAGIGGIGAAAVSPAQIEAQPLRLPYPSRPNMPLRPGLNLVQLWRI